MRTHGPVLIFAALSSLPLTANASTHYVSPLGSTNWSASTSMSTPCGLPTANDSASAGDIVILAAGTYSSELDPVHGGTASSPLVFLGVFSHPESVTVTAINIGSPITANTLASRGQWVTVKWMTTTGQCAMNHWKQNDGSWVQCNRDSLDHIAVNSTATIVVDGTHLVLSNSSGTAGFFEMIGVDNNYVPIALLNDSCTVTKCQFTLTLPSSFKGVHIRTASADTIAATQFVVQAGSVVGGNNPLWAMYHVHGLVVNDSNIALQNNSNISVVNFVARDSTQACHFARDTIIATGGTAATIQMEGDGTLSHSSRHNRYDNCVIKVANADAGAGALYYQDGIPADTVQFCSIIAGNGAPVVFLNGVQDSGWVFRHNSCYTSGATAIKSGTTAAGADHVVANVFYTTTDPAACTSAVGVLGAQLATRDSNLYFYSGGSDSSHAVGVNGACAAPSGSESISYWRSPQFDDSTYSAVLASSPNLGIRVGSWAMGTQWPDFYVGATYSAPFVATNCHVTVGHTTAVVEWTEPLHAKSDGSLYALKRSGTQIITESDWAGATLVASGTALDAGAGECISVGDLNECSTYYFAVRLANTVGTGPISNSPKASTKCTGFGEVYCVNGHAQPTAARPSLGGDVPEQLELVGPRPNPGVGRVGFELRIPESMSGASYRLSAYDLAGREVERIDEGMAVPGSHAEVLRSDGVSGRPLEAGIYFVRLWIAGQTMTRMIIIR